MGALQQVTVPTRVIADTSAMEACGLAELCTIRYESEERFYDVTLAAAVASVALEGMNRFEIAIRGTHKCTGIRDKLHAVLEINIREEMNCISIEGDEPLFFTISRRSLDPLDEDIDSSIHEVIDLGLLERRIHAAPRSKESRQACLLFDEAAANLVKASVSALLAHATECHRVPPACYPGSQSFVRLPPGLRARDVQITGQEHRPHGNQRDQQGDLLQPGLILSPRAPSPGGPPAWPCRPLEY